MSRNCDPLPESDWRRDLSYVMAVFDGVHYSLSPSLSPTRKHELASLLDVNGAVSHPPHTHLIALAASHAHNDVHWSDTSLKVVSDRWVDRSVVMGKIQPENYYSPDPAMIFSGVVACATDLSAADLEVLSAGITALGGQWRIGLTRDVTHLFALCPGSDKYNTAFHFAPQTHMCVLTPHWFDDSVRLGRRLPETSYSWPDPLVLRPGATIQLEDDPNMTDNKRKRKPDGDAETEAGPSTSNEGEKVKVWGGRRLLLSYSLELSKSSRQAMEAGIRRAGGVLVPAPVDADDDAEEKAIDECDVLITRWRSGKAYFKAARASLLIGTLNWLFSVESSGTLYSPLDSLLWYPVPRGGVPGLVDAEICLTNYTGAARDYLKRLILLVGAKFTPSLTSGNKVLIAGFQPSPKTTRALSWSIPVVNHTWLEDCFVAWRSLTVGLERYIVYPPGVDFGKILMTRNSESSSMVVPTVSGGALPGGRGIGVIDLAYEASRDADYQDPDAVVAAGDRSRLRNDEEPLSATKQSKATPRARSRSAKATPSTKSRRGSAFGEFVDGVIEIPDDDDDEGEEQGGSRDVLDDKRATRKSTTQTSAKGRLVSKPASSAPPPGTSASAREVEEVEEVVAPDQDVEEEAEEVADPEDANQPVRGATYKLATKDKGKSKEGGLNGIASDREKGTSTSKSKPTHDRPENPSRESNRAPQAVTHPSLSRPKSNLVRRSLTSSAAHRSEVESEGEVLEIESTKKDTRGRPSTSKAQSTANATRQKGKAVSLGSNSDSESSVPPRRATGHTSTPIKSGMKPKPKANGKMREDAQDEIADEGRIRPANTKTGEKRKEKERSGAIARNGDSATRRDVEKATKKKKATPRSPTRSPSPTPHTKNSRSPKRRLSVVIPSVSKEYFSQSSNKEVGSSPSDPKQKVARGTSIRVAAAEASTSASKRAKPSPAVSSGKTKPSAKAKGGRPAGSEDEDETSIVVASPMTSTSRGGPRRIAANKANTKLRDVVMPDVISYEKERKDEKRRRSMGGESVISTKDDDENERGAKRRKLDKVGSKDNMKGKARKVAREVEEEEEEEEAEVEDVVLVSKQKLKATKGKAKAAEESDDEVATRPGKGEVRGSQEKKTGPRKSEGSSRNRTNIRLMTTGATLLDDVVKRLTKLGVQMTTKPADCTHLVAKGIVRTEKFLCAMAKSPYILTEEWANVSAKANKLLPEIDYLLSDPAAEQKWDFKFVEATQRSKEAHGGSSLFKQMTFYVTPKVSIDTKLLKNVVLAGGGQVQTSNPTVRILKGKENRYVVSCPEDKSIWRPLAQEGYTIYSAELILQAALKQKIEWENKECIVTG